MSLKQKLRDRQLTIGSWLSIANPAVAEIMAKVGFEWLAIDMEHSALSADQCQELIRVIDLCGAVPLVRVGANDSLLIKRAMDAGAHGVIVPMVNSKLDAEKAVSAVKYPPEGNRGVGLFRAQGYGASFNEYKEWLRDESMVIVQIEHIKGVNSLEEIMEVEGIDVIIVGPYDLSGSLGVPGNFDDKKMLAALEKIQNSVPKKDVSLGYHIVFPSLEAVEKKINQGYSFIAYGVDFIFLGETCRDSLSKIRNLDAYNSIEKD